ncbi:hypothetical protein PTSG_02492 [Salpingoeca rosetta]|uniref:Uncharacterized protein n=1 Tax=Salpingoeca rosetta (strain ATCC 50818 / BSB-021) TaxID=946362 RepID=F2U2C7_SALR5|nr:uncharacterized protein PTSG_02492 [Salpingoeca rosetta]EGD81779.1 hypothetical protein PTSG_02492 [Salpingoeca rosetta]|eukprot:XP_004996983.1 hypothetical protein PTSG_02492 [Salpingoeca rosetta]
MYLFDVATDWNLFRTMQGSYSEFNDDFNPIFLGNQSDLMCTCSCTSGDPCVTPLSNTTLCDTFALNEGGSSCNIRHVVTLDSRSGGQCDYTFGYDKTSSLIDELSSLRWASLAINIIITPLVLYYLVWQARQGLDHDEATISRVMSRKSSRTSNFDAHQLETIQQEQLQHKRQSQTNFSGSVSSDHLPTAPNAKHPCFNCNFELHPKARFCPNCGAKQMEFNKDTMQGKQIRRWLKRKESPEAGRVHLCGVTGVFAALFIVSIVACPALFMVGFTSARDILDFSDTQIAVVFILASIFALPLLIFIVMFLLFICEECGYDSTNIGFNCQEDACCICDGDACCENDGDGGCCDCDCC